MGPKINENIPVIEVGSKIKLPKGRVNRDIINLAP